jgi:CRP-like cAMP-binding protein
MDGWEQRSLFGTVRRLHQLQAFTSLPWGGLVKLATTAETRTLAPGDSPPASREPMGSLYYVLDGRVELRNADSGSRLRELEPDSVIPCRSPGTTIVATDAARLLRLDGDTLLELAADHPPLVATVLSQAQVDQPKPEAERPSLVAPAAVSA